MDVCAHNARVIRHLIFFPFVYTVALPKASKGMYYWCATHHSLRDFE